MVGSEATARDTGGAGEPGVAADWHALDEPAVLARLAASRSGLSDAEAARRLAEHGKNELRQAEPIRPLRLLIGQFKSLIVGLLIVAALISGVLGEWPDCLAILAIVIANGLIGFYQEYDAERSLAALRSMTSPQARVRRDGRTLSIPAAQVVAGDAIELEAGDLVPADARLLEAVELKTIEAALTGESGTVHKSNGPLTEEVPLADRSNMVFLGTSVAAGKALAIATATGMDTEIGGIAELLASAADEGPTPLQRRLHAVGRVLVWCALGIVGLIVALGLMHGIPAFELFLTAVSLAVAAVPEGLPAVVTIALAVGVQRMATRRALVRRMHAVETLGSANVICTDKTGTLTVGEMTVRELWTPGAAYTVTGEGYGPEGVVRPADDAPRPLPDGPLQDLALVLVGCNGARLTQVAPGDPWTVLGDPTEGALLTAGGKLGVTSATLERDLPQVAEIPFDSERKRMSVIRRRADGALLALVKGAPDILIALCTRIRDDAGVRPITDADRQAMLTANADMAGRALRVLGAATRELGADADTTRPASVEAELTFVGLAGMHDPPRAEARDAVGLAQSAGIRVVMITGDHPHTALAIAREIGIARPQDVALSGNELDDHDDASLRRAIADVAVYARVTAAHKLRVVRAWQADGGVVAMTGDGVNDAPAIKGADVGIAMGQTGTEVTKEAADIVITDDNFASIVAAIEEGRGIYDNIKKTMQYLLAGNVGELLLMAACVTLGLPLPLLPIQLLWINLFTDGLPALCLATDPIDADVMRRPPRQHDERITDRGFVTMMIATGTLTSAVALAVYLYALRHAPVEVARSAAFSALVYAELLRSFGARSATRPIWRVGLLSNPKLALVVSASAAVTFFAPYNAWLGSFLKVAPLSLRDSLALLAAGAIPLLVLEAWKLVRRAMDHTK